MSVGLSPIRSAVKSTFFLLFFFLPLRLGGIVKSKKFLVKWGLLTARSLPLQISTQRTLAAAGLGDDRDRPPCALQRSSLAGAGSNASR